VSSLSSAVALEKSLQDIFEKNLETLLAVRFLRSEYIIEGGRMDSLGIDENGIEGLKRGRAQEGAVTAASLSQCWRIADARFVTLDGLGRLWTDRPAVRLRALST
jgi:hypothetical protein